MQQHPFRFGVVAEYTQSREGWISKARRVEELGFTSFLVPDHLDRDIAPIAAMMSAVEATTSLRVGSFVFNNDLRHPAVLAKEVATLDMLSGGRFEFGIGSGYKRSNYEQTGIPFDAAGIRLSRLEEALHIIKGFFTGEYVSFTGHSYTVSNLQGRPKPVQHPYPPIYIGGGGRRVLSFAAREANIIGFTPKSTPTGLDMTTATLEATLEKVEWVRQTAGKRLAELELGIMTFIVAVSDQREPVAHQLAEHLGLSPMQVLHSPHILIGSINQIMEQLQMQRERFGLSYIQVPEAHMEKLAPVVACLTSR
jgi:probable F420-dependent oxidoreductase